LTVKKLIPNKADAVKYKKARKLAFRFSHDPHIAVISSV